MMAPLRRPALSSEAVAVVDSSQVGEVRRTVAAACRAAGLDDTDVGRASIVATEAATNLLKHAGGGEVVVSARPHGDAAGVDLLVLDRGPGIQDARLAMTDGHSTAGTAGNGLGAIRRQSDRFDLYSQSGQGTALWSRIQGEGSAERVELCGISVPKPGESECGDAWGIAGEGLQVRLVLADGLGHGPAARDAALVAVEAAQGTPRGPGQGLEDAHHAARGTRGAAIAVVEVDLAAGQVRFAGFGNIAGVLLGDERPRKMVSMNGTVGQGQLRVREFTYSFSPGTLLVLSSDGLGSQWSLDPYPGLAARSPALVAGVLYRDHSRRRDDTTIVAARLGTAA
jgi:anti-sigma regulatory factor (Ser/Thr protein kinase)